MTKQRRRPKVVPKPSPGTASRVSLLGASALAVCVVAGIVSRQMGPVVAAIYFAFGFAVQRASFCSASLISAVVLSRSWRGMVAILVAVLVGMLGFGLLHGLGSITVYPSRISVLPAAVGGLLFGVGMVLAGGCVSGSLFKATEGRLPSILAVGGIFTGLAAGMSPWGQTAVGLLAGTSASWNPPPNLVATDGGSYAHLLVGLALVALGAVSLVFRRRILSFEFRDAFPVCGRWPLFAVAVIVGLLGWAAFLAGPALGKHFPLGASHIPSALLRLGLRAEVSPVGLLAWAFVLGSTFSAWLRGEIRWRSAPRDMLMLAFFGGVLVGMGAIVGQGCFVGQILSGSAMLSAHALVFGLVMIPANWVTTLLYLRGW